MWEINIKPQQYEPITTYRTDFITFQYPKLYHQLYENGMLNMGAKYPYHSYCPIEYKNGDRLPNKEWLEQEYPKLKENPPLFLYVDWFQVLTPSQLAKEFEFFKPTFNTISSEPKILLRSLCKGCSGWLYGLLFLL